MGKKAPDPAEVELPLLAPLLPPDVIEQALAEDRQRKQAPDPSRPRRVRSKALMAKLSGIVFGALSATRSENERGENTRAKGRAAAAKTRHEETEAWKALIRAEARRRRERAAGISLKTLAQRLQGDPKFGMRNGKPRAVATIRDALKNLDRLP